jgi:hypothetical protein
MKHLRCRFGIVNKPLVNDATPVDGLVRDFTRASC